MLHAVNIGGGDVTICSFGANEKTYAGMGGENTLASRQAFRVAVGNRVVGTTSFASRVQRLHDGRGEFEIRATLSPVAAVEIRKPSAGPYTSCARCKKVGRIVLNGKAVKCPQCKGKGSIKQTLASTDAPHTSTATDGSSRSAEALISEWRKSKETSGKGRVKVLGVKKRCSTCAGSGMTTTGAFDGSKVKDPTNLLAGTPAPVSGRSAKSLLAASANGGAGLMYIDCPAKGCLNGSRIVAGGLGRCPTCHGSGKVPSGEFDSSETLDSID
jgi:hypothetical protein